MECSAKANRNMKEVFEDACKIAVGIRKPIVYKKESKCNLL